jgi:uncharacterized protein (DUF2249 family)
MIQTIDVRELACSERRTRIFEVFEALMIGDGFVFLNDHAPMPLYHKFCERYPDQFSWDYLEQGPQVWRTAIRRIA